MKHLIITIVVIWAFFQISSLIWSSKGQPPSVTFTRLLEPPQYRLANPYENGYYYLLGFSADAALDPAKVGHEIWLETTASQRASGFDYDKPGRLGLQIGRPLEELLPSWSSENPVSEFRNTNTRLQTLSSRDRTILVRYEHLLSMPFEDMGFGHPGTPRFVEIFLGHRLYVADGFSHQTALGMQRLKNDLHTWRSILRVATTITTKVMALIVITDDLRLLSTLLSQPAVNKTLLAMTPNIAPPLTTAESSLRWPLQHQFTLGLMARIQVNSPQRGRQNPSIYTNSGWRTLPISPNRSFARSHILTGARSLESRSRYRRARLGKCMRPTMTR
jgi:hypothetical protein